MDLLNPSVRVGKSKTTHGHARVVPLDETACKAMTTWAQQFPKRKPDHFVLPSERVGFSGNDEIAAVFDTDPEQGAYELENGVEHPERRGQRGMPLPRPPTYVDHAPTGAWRCPSGSHIARRLESRYNGADAKRYAHFGNSAQRQAVAVLDAPQQPAAPSPQPTEQATPTVMVPQPARIQ